jgi:RNA polymerase sigma-70 factor (ECF subfamily)
LSQDKHRKPTQAEHSDEELVERIRNSDEGAFTVLYERYYQRVYNFSYLRLRNHADTEEAVQETFTAVFRSMDRYREKSSVISWIYGIAKNTVNNNIRRSAAQERRVDRAETELVRNHQASSACTPEEELTLRRCAESLQDQFAALSEWQAEIFELRHIENLPISEISARTSRSSDAVRSSLCRVKRLLLEAAESSPLTGPTSAVERSLA